MLTTNIDVEDRLINGQIGTVAKIKLNSISSKLEVIYVKFDDKNAGEVRIRKSCDRFAMNNCAVPITAVLARIKLKGNRPSSPEIRRTQFPLTLAWACTVHKVQGLTLEKVFCFDLFKQKQFNCGQVYVAMSRVKSLPQLLLLGDIMARGVRVNTRFSNEYERLRSQNFEHNAPNIIYESNSENFVFTLLNIRSLKKHCCDIVLDSKIVKSDIIALTETRLKP